MTLTRPDQVYEVNIINTQQAKTHLSRLLDEAMAGADIVIGRAGRPLVRLVPVTVGTEPRRLGLLRGKVKEKPGCWDPDPELEALFSSGEVFPPKRKRKPRKP